MYVIYLLFQQHITKLFIFKRILFNEENHSGFIEIYLRNKRSHDPIFSKIKRKYRKRKIFNAEEFVVSGELQPQEKVDNITAYLQNLVIRTSNDRDNAILRMSEINLNRLTWIQEKKPTITDILETYPIYLSCIEIVITLIN